MLRSAVAAVTVAASLALAPPTSADPEVFGCVGGDQAVTGDGSTYVTAAVGYLVHSEGTPVWARCIVLVNGYEIGATPAGTFGPGHTVVYGPIVFTASPGDYLETCFHGWSSHGGIWDCRPITTTQVPPQVVWDAACMGLDEIGSRGFNILGLVVVQPGGDVLVNGSRVHDC